MFADREHPEALSTSAARKKWAQLKEEGAILQDITYKFYHPTKGVGTIDDWGKVVWQHDYVNL